MEGKLFGPFRFAEQIANKLTRNQRVQLFSPIRIFDTIGGVNAYGIELKPGGGVTSAAEGRFRWRTHTKNPWFLLSDMGKKFSIIWARPA